MALNSKVPLAWKNLTHDRRRLAAALGGVSFAVLLMFMQTGFKNALYDSTVQVVEELDADLLLVSRARYALLAKQTFPRERIYQARGCPGVESVRPLYIELFQAVWHQPCRRGDPDYSSLPSKGNPIRVLACDLAGGTFLDPEIAEAAGALQEPGTALIDVCSKREPYGLPDSEEALLEHRRAELCGRKIRLVGTFELGTDFANDGNLIMSEANFAEYFPHRARGKEPLSVVDLGVVKIRPGADVRAVKRRLSKVLPDDVVVFTKRELVDHEIGFWASSTPIGVVFFIGTVLGWVVGVIICYQIIHSDIADHMAEYATLKAMGYRNRYFIALVLKESLYLSVLGFLPGLLISLALYQCLASWTGLLMILNFQRAATVLLLTTAMCVLSGCLAMRKVLAADPAELF